MAKKKKRRKGLRLFGWMFLILTAAVAAAAVGSRALILGASAGRTYSDPAAIPENRVGLVLGCVPQIPGRGDNLFLCGGWTRRPSFSVPARCRGILRIRWLSLSKALILQVLSYWSWRESNPHHRIANAVYSHYTTAPSNISYHSIMPRRQKSTLFSPLKRSISRGRRFGRRRDAWARGAGRRGSRGSSARRP